MKDRASVAVFVAAKPLKKKKRLAKKRTGEWRLEKLSL